MQGNAVTSTESAIAQLMNRRYGDGVVYVPRERSKQVLQTAIAEGYVSAEGFVTRKGRALLARTASVPNSVGE